MLRLEEGRSEKLDPSCILQKKYSFDAPGEVVSYHMPVRDGKIANTGMPSVV